MPRCEPTDGHSRGSYLITPMKLKKSDQPLSRSQDAGAVQVKVDGQEYALAAFLTGGLRASSRREFAAALAKDAEARELLHMAFVALQAAAA